LSLEKTWQLYEYWCFFQVIAALGQLAGPGLEFDASSFLQTHADRISLALPEARVMINRRLAIHFQKRYSYYGWCAESCVPGRTGSYSHEMIPDISIEVRNDAGFVDQIVLLDPKYRASRQSLDEAMDEMHRYKDAIVGPERQRLVRTALILCPNKEYARALYFDPCYQRVHGFGALELCPDQNGSGSGDLKSWLQAQLPL
jgi:predicted component of viral defense system (DUF524 family)